MAFDSETRPLRLDGRYMTPERSEFPCHTLAVSPLHLHISAAGCPYRGQRVVLYLQQAGRIEGVVTAVARDEFWVRIDVSERKREQLVALWSSLLGGEQPSGWNPSAVAMPAPSRPRRQLSAAYVAAVAEALDLTCPVAPQEAEQEQRSKPTVAQAPIDATRRYLDFI